MTKAPLLVLGVGNPSRGDDALGPALLDALHEQGVGADGTVEMLTDFQLQVEHLLDLEGRRAVLFVDAAWPGAGPGTGLEPIVADSAAPLSSHALRPQAVLRAYWEVLGRAPPPAWQLAVEGAAFELGAPLSDKGLRNLRRALALAAGWLQSQRSG
jgi:hydrogenase maturation protease